MKKLLLSACVAALAMSASAFNLEQPSMANQTPVKMENVKEAPAALQAKMVQKWTAKLKATPNFPASTADDLVGGYAYVYRQYTGGFTTQPDTISNNYTLQRDTEDNVDLVAINKIDDSNIRITGMFMFPVEATMGTSGSYTTFTIDKTQAIYHNASYGYCTLRSIYYYEGDETYSAGWYIGDATGFLTDEGIVFDTSVHFYMMIASGNYAGYRLGWIYEPGSVMVPVTDYNALMTYDYTYSNSSTSYSKTSTYDYPVVVSEDENYVVTVENFGGLATNPITLTLAEDHTWAAAENQVMASTNNGDFVLNGTDGTDFYQLTGTGTETVLTFGSAWTGLSDTGYWYGLRGAATITRTDDGEFVYPTTVVEEPALYILGEVNDNSWAPNVGVEMLTEDGVNFTADVVLDGRNASTLKTADAGVNYFSFTTKLAEDANDWDGIAQYRIGAITDDGSDYWITDDQLNLPLGLQSGTTAFRLPAGGYTFKVNLEAMTLTVVKNTATAISDLSAANVAGVKYVNLAGQVSSMPFEGVNLVVTTLTDGTTNVTKVIK